MIHTVIAHIRNNLIVKSLNNGMSDYTELKSDDMIEFMSTHIMSMKECEIMWIDDLKLYGEDIVALLKYMDYKDVSEEALGIKRMPSKSFRYIMTIQGNCYAIYVRVSKKTLYIYNANNLLSGIDHQEISRAWGDGDYKNIRKLVDAMYSGIESLSGFQEKCTPFTLSMLASRKWKSIENLYYCDNLTDCNAYKSPQGSHDNLSCYIRESYQAGWNYMKPMSRENYKGKPGRVYDINSSYPYMMSTKKIPWGEPTNFIGDIPDEAKDDYHYYFVRVKMQFDLKEGKHFPYIRKRGDMLYMNRDYLETSDIIVDKGEGKLKKVSKIIGLDGKKREVYPELILSKTDYELIHRHYNIRKEEVIDGVYYKVCTFCFKHFINYYYNMKLECSKNGDKGGKRVSKMIMNAAAGCLAKRPERINVTYDEEMNPITMITKNPSPSYIHMASAILSYAREYVYEAACANYDNFLYSDTDSLHLIGDNPKGIKIDNEKLGAWKVEYEFTDSCYYKKKSYILKLNDGRYHITMAGVSNDYKRLIEDIIGDDGKKTPFQYIIDMRMEKYGSAGNIARMIEVFDPVRDTAMPNTPVYGYTNDSKKFFDFVDEIHNAVDKLGILQYINFPTGIDQCQDFEIRHRTEWHHMS